MLCEHLFLFSLHPESIQAISVLKRLLLKVPSDVIISVPAYPLTIEIHIYSHIEVALDVN